MDQLNQVYLTFDDLPSELSDELKEYLLRTYPDTYVNISLAPLEAFNKLPHELLSRILRSERSIQPDLKPSTHYISKQTRKDVIPDIYRTECNKSLTASETMKELKNNESAICIFIYTLDKDYQIYIPTRPFSFFEENETVKLKSTVMSSFNHIKSRNVVKIAKNILRHDSSFDLNYSSLDILSAYNVRKQRSVCMQYNLDYANKKLLSMYNEIFSEDLIVENLTIEDLADIFICNNLCRSLEYDVINLIGTYNVSDEDNWDIVADVFIPAFEEARDILKKHVMQLTDSISAYDNPHELV